MSRFAFNFVPVGFFSLVLHAHLPFVRHPDAEGCLEEDWLYEAITEVYLPLLAALARLRDDGTGARLTVSLSPTLCEMLSDELLRARYTRRLTNLLELAGKELARTFREEPQFHLAAQDNFQRLRAAQELWDDVYSRDLVAAFRSLQDDGATEITTCAATHALLPLVSTEEARRAQVRIAAANHRKHFGKAPRGIWLPECAYADGLETHLAGANIEYFFADAHAVLHGEPRPRYGVHAPVRVANGVAAFARDLESSEQVWSANVGYPGDPAYREFYRDLGWDAPLEYLRPHLGWDARRRDLGLKYHRVTGRDVPLEAKLPYDPEAAAARVRAHAQHFVGERIRQARELSDVTGARAPLVVAPYDAELFGHWWHEGVEFLECVLRLLDERREEIACVTPGDYLDASAARALPLQTQRLSPSSWGEGGYFQVWLSEENAWLYPLQHAAEARMTALADRFATRAPNEMRGAISDKADNATANDSTANGATVVAGATDDPSAGALGARALRQCARELLLAQSSDWAFQIYRGATADYAARRFRTHSARFDALAGQLESGALDERQLAAFEHEDNLFPELDPRVFRTRMEAHA